MGTWTVDTKQNPGVLTITMEGYFSLTEMESYLNEHNAAVDSFHGLPYRVFVDIRKLQALSPACSELQEKAKRYSAGKSNFRGSAVLVSAGIIAQQHERTSLNSGVMSTEIITVDESEAKRHLASLIR